MTSKQPRAASKSRAIARKTIFGPPPILEGEDARDYHELFARVSAEISPDFIEEIWVRDIVDLTWEILRWRRLKLKLLADEGVVQLTSILSLYVHRRASAYVEEDDPWQSEAELPPSPAEKLAQNWAAGEPAAIKRVENMVASGKFEMDTVYALALVDEFDNIERLDQMIMSAESRRNATLREIYRRRAILSKALRTKAHEIEEAEFEEIEPKRVSNKRAA
jgi:hypothetical protein